MNVRQRRNSGVIVDSFAPMIERLQKRCQVKFLKGACWLCKIPDGPLQDRPHSYTISGRIVMEGYGHLDQSLAEFLVVRGSGSPHVFEDFVGIEKLASIE